MTFRNKRHPLFRSSGSDRQSWQIEQRLPSKLLPKTSRMASGDQASRFFLRQDKNENAAARFFELLTTTAGQNPSRLRFGERSFLLWKRLDHVAWSSLFLWSHATVQHHLVATYPHVTGFGSDHRKSIGELRFAPFLTRRSHKGALSQVVARVRSLTNVSGYRHRYNSGQNTATAKRLSMTGLESPAQYGPFGRWQRSGMSAR